MPTIVLEVNEPPAVAVGLTETTLSISTITPGGGPSIGAGQNIGTGAPVYKDNMGSVLRLRTLKAANATMSVSQVGDEVHFAATTTVDFASVQAALAAATSSVAFNAQLLSNISDPVGAQDAATKSFVEDFIAANIDANLSPLNKHMVALVTGGDNSLACATAIFSTPPVNAWALVLVNGLSYQVGNGIKVSVPCYFSGDGGITARATGALAAGDLLYWNGTVAGFQLDGGDRIDFVFEAL
jgi:hypothetical protein